MPDFMKYKERPVYLWEDNEQVFVGIEPNGNVFAKFPHGNEYQIDTKTRDGYDLMTMAVFADHEVTNAQYDLDAAIVLPDPLVQQRF